MDPSSQYSWPMQPDGNQQHAWQLGHNGMPQGSDPHSTSSLYAASGSSNSTGTVIPNLYPALPGSADQYMPQQQNFQQQQNPVHLQPQLYPQQPYSSVQWPSSMASSGSFPADSYPINEATLNELRAAYPNAPLDVLINAVLHSSQQFGQQQGGQTLVHQQSSALPHAPQSAPYAQASPSYAPAPTHNDLFRPQSDHSLASALAFSPSSLHPSASANGVGQTVQVGSSPASAPAAAPSSSAGAKEKQSKLRQSKLAFLPSIAKSVSQKETPSPPAPTTKTPATSGASTDVTVVADSGSEPGTPPLPPAKALTVKASTKGAGSAAAKASAATKHAEVRKLSDTVRQWLSRSPVNAKPQEAASKFASILSDLDPSGKFRNPRPTEAEDRRLIVEALNSIVNLETGKGYTEVGRKRFFAALMGLYAARHILSAWLRAATPPKKVTEETPDRSPRYKTMLLPLLNILNYVEVKRDYLTDDAALGKAITGVSLRAADPSARKLAQGIKAKWTKVVEDAEAKSSAPAQAAASAPTRSSPSTSTGTTATKRKPTEATAATVAEASTKRYKSASAATTTSAGNRLAKAASTSSSSSASTSATANRGSTTKTGVDFFATGAVKKPAAIARPPPSASAQGANRTNAHQKIMSLMDKYSGGTGSNRATSATADASSGNTQPKEKVKKRVTWKADSELVAVKLIEPADYGQGDEEEAHTEGAGDEHLIGLALKQSISTMEALMDWHEPRQVLVAGVEKTPVGSESVEGPYQTQRNAGVERKVYAEGEEEPTSPDESQLGQPGLTSEAPAELMGAETVEIPTPWMIEEDPDADTFEGASDLPQEAKEEEAATKLEETPATTSTAIPSTANLSELLSKVGQSVGVTAAQAPASNESRPTPPAAPLNIDMNQLQSILNLAKGNSAGSNAVNAAMASSKVTSDNLSNLLSSLSRSSGATQPAASSSNASEQPDYWQRPYSDHESNTAAPVESYPGEFHQDYKQESTTSYQYGQPPAQKGYRYGGGNDGGWDSDQPSYGGYQYGGSRDSGQSYGGGGGGGGGGGWQSKRHTVPCKFFAQGTCRNGSSCSFRH